MLQRRHWFGIAVALGLPWCGLVVAILLLRAPAAVPGDPTAASAAPAVTHDALPTQIVTGPWGQLELNRVVIEPPDELITVDAHRIEFVDWHFPGFAEAQVTALLSHEELNPEQREVLLDRQNWQLRSDRIVVRVPKPIVLGLSPEARRVIYAVLSPFRENNGQWAPASFRAESAHDWFANSGLTADTVAIVQPLLYRRGNSLLFSDLSLILADIKTQRQRLLLLRTLARSTTQFAKLRIHAQSDLNAIVDYWSGSQRNRDIAPLLRSIPRDGDGFTIDIVHLLPPVARRLVYTYDSPPPPGQEPFRDCHWTALNFANSEPDDRYRDLQFVRDAYQSNYLPVTDDPRLGDLFLFVTEKEIVLHASVHIAGDLVFTKNGSWAAAPWVLMRMPDLLALYPSDTPLDIRHLRKKN